MGEFSVYQEFENGMVEKVRDHVEAEEAVKAAHHYCHSVGAQLGFTVKVIIEDGDGYCNFLWERGQLIYPTQEERDAHAAKTQRD